MATRIATPCRAGCGSLAGPKGYCTKHQQDYYRSRLPGKAVYKTPLHQAWRTAILQRDPICVHCKQKKSVIADHIKPIVLGGTFSMDNGRGLCRRCDGILGARYRFGR